jgi:hypothetical protein
MLVVDLHCEGGHLFEGWFASADDLSSQKERGLLSCPVCGSHEVTRRPSASRLNVSALKAAKLEGSSSVPARPVASPPREVVAAPKAASAAHDPEAAQTVQAMHKLYWQAVRHVVAHTEDVGERFVDEVRGMHHGDVPERAIRGQATPEERAELREEGIDVLSMPIPAGLKGTVQ